MIFTKALFFLGKSQQELIINKQQFESTKYYGVVSFS